MEGIVVGAKAPTPYQRKLGHYLRIGLAALVLLACASAAGAEYAVLRNGQRLRITGYQRAECQGQPARASDASAASQCYRLYVPGGTVEIAVSDLFAIEPEDTFGPAAAAMPRTPFDTLIRAAAIKYRLDERLLTSVIAAESNFDPRAISRKDARGLMQLMPATVRRFAVRDVFDPEQNIDAGARYLRELLDRYSNDLPLALAAYNAGPERVAQYGGVPPFRETREYIARVTARLAKADGEPGER